MTKALNAAMVFLTFALVFRGLDYVNGSVDGQGEAERAPLVWGVTCLVTGVVVIVGLLAHRTKVMIAGSLMASAIYVMFVVYQVPLIFDSAPPDDWRVCGDYIAFAGLWLVVCATLTLRFHVAQARRGGDSGDVAGAQ